MLSITINKTLKTDWTMKNENHSKFPQEMPNDNIVFDNPFPDFKLSKNEFEILSYGTIPENMDDKWFMYVDDKNVVRIYHSWTNDIMDEFYFIEKDDMFYIEKLIHNSDLKTVTENPNIHINLSLLRTLMENNKYLINKLDSLHNVELDINLKL